MLNVKQIALKMEGEGPKRVQLSATGPVEVTAGMIVTSGDMEVTNPDLVILAVLANAPHWLRASASTRARR